MLGHDVGWAPRAAIQKQRACAALDRMYRVAKLRKAKMHNLKLLQTYVMSMLYGVDASGDVSEHKEINAQARQMTWGAARHATNWPAALAFSGSGGGEPCLLRSCSSPTPRQWYC